MKRPRVSIVSEPPIPPQAVVAAVTAIPPAGESFARTEVALETAGVAGAPATPVMKSCVFPTPE